MKNKKEEKLTDEELFNLLRIENKKLGNARKLKAVQQEILYRSIFNKKSPY